MLDNVSSHRAASYLGPQPENREWPTEASSIQLSFIQRPPAFSKQSQRCQILHNMEIAGTIFIKRVQAAEVDVPRWCTWIHNAELLHY